MSNSLDLVLKIAAIVQLVIFAMLYRPKPTWKASKQKSSHDVGAMKKILPFIQVAIGLVVLASLYHERSLHFLVIGNITGVFGLFIIFWAKRTLGNNFSECVEMYTPNEIITQGPYKNIRHPIYSGNILFLSGLAVACQSWILSGIVVFFAVFYNKSAAIEENELMLIHPQYKDYVRKTRRFIPRF